MQKSFVTPMLHKNIKGLLYLYVNGNFYATNNSFFFSFQMKPREAFSILATALLIGTVIAQDQLFECPRGKENESILIAL